MTYKIYRKVKIDRIYMEKVTPLRRASDIGNSTRAREPYEVQMMSINNGAAKATFRDFQKHIHVGDVVSVAISDKKDLIAVINHTRNTEAKMKIRKMKWDDMAGLAFFLAFPLVLGGAIFRRALISRGWDNLTIGIAGVVILIVILLLVGVNKQYKHSAAAFRELKRG